MDLMHPLVLRLGLPILLAFWLILHLIRRKQTDRYRGGRRAANTSIARNLPEYKRLKILHRVFSVLLEASLAFCAAMTLVLIARPVKNETVETGLRKRDIYLCLDVSYSIYQLNAEIVDALKDVVRGMDGDRFGISIYNTSTVTYVPMTDDYDFIISKLDELSNYFALQKEYSQVVGDAEYYEDLSDEAYEKAIAMDEQMEIYEAGTLTGNRRKGSSLVGEGLATCLYSFPSIGDDQRTRIIIMATDNLEEAEAKPVVELPEAAQLCKKNGATVFGLYPDISAIDGIASQERYDQCMQQYETAVESTGGALYKAGEGMTVDDILADLQAQEAMAVRSISVVRQVDQPVLPAVLLFIGLMVLTASGMILRKI